MAEASLVPITGDSNFSITARKQDVIIAGQVVHAMIYEDDNNVLKDAAHPAEPIAPTTPYPNGIPILLMNLTLGQVVTCRFTNKLPSSEVMEGASIHWHGLEVDNDSDGAAVTQDSVLEKQTYTYQTQM
jgi:FtsP/CotA-like multicopper oxidase with cupredoxin domain